jgi:ParB/RepB/Spo0J family partition protein
MDSQMMPLAQLKPADWNPRGELVDADLSELLASVQVHGVLTPLLVRGDGALDSTYEIVAGHRRFRAAQLAGLAEVPVVVLDVSDAEAREVAIVENLQREEMPPMEEARALKALVDEGQAPAAIAQRIGKPERYVWERLRLLRLVPEAAVLLITGRISVLHAVVLARLDAADQARVIDPDHGGLFTREAALFNPVDDDWRTERESNRDPWAGLKPVSVRELQRHIAEHVRFDPAQAAAAAPLDFGPVADQVATAVEAPGRGKKVVHITYDHFVKPDARSTERTYTVRAWKRADGEQGSKPCDRSVLGVVVVGPAQGEAFRVCVHKDCDVHWAQERKEAERRASQSSRGERAHDDAEERKAKARQEREEAARRAWEAEKITLLKALGAHVAALKPDICQVLRERRGYQVVQAAKEFGVTLTPATAGAVLWLGSMNVWDRSTFDAIAKRWKFNPKASAKPIPKPQKVAVKAKTKPAAKAAATATTKKRRAA